MAAPVTPWSLKEVPVFESRTEEERRVLWEAELPLARDVNPALWDTLLGFFEDATVACSERPGDLVTTPRQLLRNLKFDGREPRAGREIVEELFKRGDLVRADKLTIASANEQTKTSSIRSTLSSYIWGAPKEEPLGLDDPVVPMAALGKVAARAKDALSGPVSSDDIHTVTSFANEMTARSSRDAEAVIAHLVSKGSASVMQVEPSGDGKTAVVGFKFGSSPPTDADKGVLQTKAALQRMNDLVAHLTSSVEQETAAATAAARAGNKTEAVARLRKKKLLDTKLAGARASAHKLTDILMSVDEAASNKEAVQALEIGMESLTAATSDGVTADRIDSIAASYAEAASDQEDVRVALQQLNQGVTDDFSTEEAELNAMMAAEDAGFKVDAPNSAEAAKAEQEELNKIMAELGIQPGDTESLPIPPSPEGMLPARDKPATAAVADNAA